jgi:predicted Zn-dependent peptidase
MQRLGEESGGYTTNDYTCYGFTSPTGNLDEALWRSVDAWMALKLTEPKVAKERQVVMEEFNQGEDRPDYKVYYQIERLMFRDHPYKRDTIGLKDVIENSKLSTFRTFYEERYVPNQMVLAAVGDFDTQAMAGKLRKAFAPYSRGKDNFELGQIEQPQAEFRMGVESMKTPSTWTYSASIRPERRRGYARPHGARELARQGNVVAALPRFEGQGEPGPGRRRRSRDPARSRDVPHLDAGAPRERSARVRHRAG